MKNAIDHFGTQIKFVALPDGLDLEDDRSDQPKHGPWKLDRNWESKGLFWGLHQPLHWPLLRLEVCYPRRKVSTNFKVRSFSLESHERKPSSPGAASEDGGLAGAEVATDGGGVSRGFVGYGNGCDAGSTNVAGGGCKASFFLIMSSQSACISCRSKISLESTSLPTKTYFIRSETWFINAEIEDALAGLEAFP
ncbi:unnamed protein product [Sphenostylis stenocarpa]|uniref:Uncharacterized protein n=1 Tax=Sphenostylis stenocarpa TaxID=92480 RepID=A0AA86RMY7_9FABA|nr:unnamed protein product [Sphenostylis stenocarpa]